MILPTQRREGDWMLFDAPLAPAKAARLTRSGLAATLLAWSAELPGGVKFARPGGSAAIHLRAERPLPEPEEAERGFATVEAGFVAASQRLGLDVGPVADSCRRGAQSDPPDLSRLCAEAGWPCDEGPEGGARVDLAVPGHYLPAHIEAREAGIFLRAELTRVPKGPRACRDALAALLLRINAAHRMVRAVFANDSGDSNEPRARLEAWLPPDAGCAQLREAIAAVAVAARHCALEAGCIATHESLARAFLARSQEERKPAT